MFEISGRVFSIQVASDVVRDGIGVELFELRDEREHFCCEIFRNNAKRIIEFCSSEIEIPYEAIVKLQEVFESEIPKEFQD